MDNEGPVDAPPQLAQMNMADGTDGNAMACIGLAVPGDEHIAKYDHTSELITDFKGGVRQL